MKKYTSLLILLLLSSSIFANEKCFDTNSGYILKNKEIKTVEKICSIEVNNKTYYVSKRCFDQKASAPCSSGFVEPTKQLEIKNLLGEFGSIGFKICYELKGEPQIFTFKSPVSNEVEETDRCMFKNGEWLEIPLLVEKFKGHLKNID